MRTPGRAAPAENPLSLKEVTRWPPIAIAEDAKAALVVSLALVGP